MCSERSRVDKFYLFFFDLHTYSVNRQSLDLPMLQLFDEKNRSFRQKASTEAVSKINVSVIAIGNCA